MPIATDRDSQRLFRSSQTTQHSCRILQTSEWPEGRDLRSSHGARGDTPECLGRHGSPPLRSAREPKVGRIVARALDPRNMGLLPRPCEILLEEGIWESTQLETDVNDLWLLAEWHEDRHHLVCLRCVGCVHLSVKPPATWSAPWLTLRRSTLSRSDSRRLDHPERHVTY